MNLILLGLEIFLILTNLVGLALLVQRIIPHYALAKAVGVLLFCLSLFFIEHFQGFGKITWFWPLSTAFSISLIYRDRATIAQYWKSELVFVLAFAYTLLWRGAFPDITPFSAERVTDLFFISNYLNGATLPPPDRWLPPFNFNCYYAFQHYSAALMGRIFGLDGGVTYNLALCVIIALIASLAWSFISQFCTSTRIKALIMVAFVMGGTGISPLIHLLIDEQKYGQEINPLASMRFAGGYDDSVNTNLAERLHLTIAKDHLPSPDFKPRVVMLETLSHQLYVGDYHPPLGGIFILWLALALVAALENDRRNTYFQALLALTVPVMVITNTWVFPLQTLLVASWVAYRKFLLKEPPDWKALVAGGLGGFLLIYPFLTEFASQVQPLPIRWVEAQDHTPLMHFIAQHWPVMLMSIFGLVQYRKRPFAAFLGGLVGVTLLLAEFIYVDDAYSADYQRFNTTLKWWTWTWAAAIAGLGAINMSASQKYLRYITLATLLLVSTYSFDLIRQWINTPKSSAGQLSGHYWLSTDATNRDILNYLRVLPVGLTLESLETGAYTAGSTFALFANKPSLLGWPEHEGMWRGNPNHINLQHQNIKDFYAGKKTDALSWLRQNKVRYAIWKGEDNKPQSKALETIQSQISNDFDWKPFYQAGDYQVGIFIRK